MDEFDEDLPVLLPPPDVADDRSSCLALLLAGTLALLLGTGWAFAESSDPAPATRGFTAAENSALEAAEYVYISSTRKDGSLGTPAEIWFWAHDGAVYVGTRPDSWRAKRIGWGRPGARISIGSRDGPAMSATGTIVRNQPALWSEFCAGIAKKYPSSWPRYEKGFRSGYADGSRILIRYVPVEGKAADARRPG